MGHHPEFETGHVFTLKRVKIEHPHLKTPDTAFNKNRWEVSCRLDDKLAAHLRDAGFNVRSTKDLKRYEEGDEVYDFLTCYSKVETAKGKNEPPKVFAADGKERIDGDSVGGGSICNVKVYSKYTEINGEMLLPAYLNSVQVIELVEAGGGFDDETNGSKDTGDDLPF